MSDVVERAAHAGEHRVDAIEHGVDQRAELVERVAGILRRDSRFGPAGPHDPAHRVRETPDRLQRRGGQNGAARETDDRSARTG